ncbi:hypothetical protein DFH29DRAFT_1008890 [Suillus ampliporus]|nr:hypothetical protein DFH29DRAFT_1008890 [Suillus ampliporus]
MADEPDPRWATIKVVTERTSSKYQPADHAAKSLDTKAYLILRHQPWRHFTLMLSFCNKYRELHVHRYDRSGGTISPPYNIVKQKDIFIHIFSSIVFGSDECIGFDTTMNIQEPNGPSSSMTDFKTPEDHETNTPGFPFMSPGPMPFESEEARPEVRMAPAQLPPAPLAPGATDSVLPSDLGTADSVLHTGTSEPPIQVPISKIQVNKNTYDILKIIFSSHGLIGRGTICYLARRDNQEYIIKDHWVLGV